MNILFIGAHFDDIELGCGGTVIKHIKNGDNVYMYILTDSEYSNYDNKLIRSKEIALIEGQNAASILGIKKGNLIHEGLKTKTLTPSFELIEKINKILDKLNIDTVYTHWVNDIHQDHSSVGQATLTASRHIPRVLMYRSNWYITNIPFKDNFYVDISPYIKTKINAIKAHENEYKKFGDNWIDFVNCQNKCNGIKINVRYAEVFEIVKYLAL